MGNHPSNHIPLERRDVSKFGDPSAVSLQQTYNKSKRCMEFNK